jgi:hypothetical protein
MLGGAVELDPKTSDSALMRASDGDEAPVPSPSRARLERPRRAGSLLLSLAAENAGGAVYGTIMIGLLLAAEDARRDGYPETIGAAAIVLALYWLMSFYTHTLGARLKTAEPLNRTLFWRSCVHELPIIEGAFVPVLALLVAWIAGASVTSGVTAAMWTAAISIVVLEFAAGWRAQLPLRGLWLQAGAGAVMGFAIIALKLVLH